MILVLVLWFSWYPIIVASKWGVLSSISASSYRWKDNKKVLFIGWLVGLGILAYALDMGLYSHLMGLGLCIAGMSPDHKQDPDSVEDAFHTAGTIIAILAAFAGLYFTYGVWIVAVVMAVGSGVLYLQKTNWIWWVEVLAMVCISVGYVMR